MKTPVIALFAITVLVFGCSDETKEKKLTKSEMLAGKTFKRWKMTALTPEDPTDHVSCRMQSVRNSDNFWIFYADGTFEYDNGDIIEDPSCTEEDEECCGDIADVYGTWEFYQNETRLRVTLIGRVDDGEETVFDEEEDLLDSSISSLTEKKLVLSQGVYTVTFEHQ